MKKASPINSGTTASNASKIPLKASPRKTGESSIDIIQLLLADHKPIKQLIKVLQDFTKPANLRETALSEFGSLLLAHTTPEEESLYEFLKTKTPLRIQGFEGDVEHRLAEFMLEASGRTKDEDLWSARLKVVADLVDHHLTEEEEKIFPQLKKYSTLEDREKLGKKYLDRKKTLQAFAGHNILRTPQEKPTDEGETSSDPGSGVRH